MANRGPKLGNGRDNNIVAGKWFGLVTTADSKIFILTAGSGNLTWGLQTQTMVYYSLVQGSIVGQR